VPGFPDYPDQLNVVRLVTLGALTWLILNPLRTRLPPPSRHLLQAFSIVMAYAAATLLWTPDLMYGLRAFVSIGAALLSATALVFLIRQDRLALQAFAWGVLISGGFQVCIAVWELQTAQHLTLSFAADYVKTWNLANIEQVIGKVAWGSLGNPNDLAGYLLLVLAVFFSRSAYGLKLRPIVLAIAWVLALLGIVVALTALDDARAFRIGLAAVLTMHLLDRLLTPRRSLQRMAVMSVALWVVIVASAWGGSLLAAVRKSQSDGTRLDLILSGFRLSADTGGLGRGIGAENALVNSGTIPLNYHNVVVQLAAELGIFVAGALLLYFVWLGISWGFVTRSARRLGPEASLARATLALVLTIYGVTSSGVLESPHYGVFLAVTVVLAGLHRNPDDRFHLGASETAGLSRIGLNTGEA